jgi:hypothetical protein
MTYPILQNEVDSFKKGMLLFAPDLMGGYKTYEDLIFVITYGGYRSRHIQRTVFRPMWPVLVLEVKEIGTNILLCLLLDDKKTIWIETQQHQFFLMS